MKIKWTVTVCSKRHHVRFFPKDGDMQAGDKNGNALPGTLVERDVTHPFQYDFCKFLFQSLIWWYTNQHFRLVITFGNSGYCSTNSLPVSMLSILCAELFTNFYLVSFKMRRI